MRINSFLYIFLIFVSLLTLGCGSDGNGLFSSTHSSSALAKVNGKLIDASNAATVTFCSPEAAVKDTLISNTDSSVRADKKSEGVYTFSVDNGSFNALVPEGEYFIVAADGDKRAVTDKRFFSARGSFITVPTITLKKTYKVSGVVSSSLISTAHIPVYIENKPFMTITDANGNFNFNDIPELDDNENYKLCTYVNKEGTEYFTFKSINSSELKSEISYNLALTQNIISQSFKRIAGHVYRGNSFIGVPDKRVYLLLVNSVKFYAAITDSEGAFAFDIATDETSAKLTLNMVDFTDASFGSLDLDLFEEPYPMTYNLRISPEALSGLFNAETKLTLYTHSSDSYTTYLSENIYASSDGYSIGGLSPGLYSYYTKSVELVTHTYCVKEKFEIKDADVSNSPEYSFAHEIPVIEVENSKYTAKIPVPTATSGWTGYTRKIKIYALDEKDEETILFEDTSLPGSTIHEIDLSKLDSLGEYKIYVETGFSYGHIKEILTSPPCPYVKH